MTNKVGAVIVSYNSAGELRQCIDSVRIQNNKNLEALAIVVDNNSKDNSVAVAKKSKAIVIESSNNLGFSKAVNLGVNKAYELGCTQILILNPDAILLPNSLESMIDCLGESKNIAAVGPLMVHNDGSEANVGYYLKAPSFLTVTCFSTLLRPWSLKKKFLVNKYEEQELVSQRTVEQIPGACLLTSKEKLDTIGLLDEDFSIWFEDVEWSYRARKKGYNLVFCPVAKVIHEGGVSFSKWESLDKSVTFYVSMKTFFKKHKPISYLGVLFVISLNAFISYLKSHDRSHLSFIKRFLGQDRGNLPS